MLIAPKTQTAARRVRIAENPQSDATPVIVSIGLGLTSILTLVVLAPSLEALSDPEEALVALFWAAGVALALWFTLSLVLLVVADRSGSGILLHWSHRITMPITRNLAKSTLALGLVALPACGASNETQPAMVLVESGVALDAAQTPLPASTSTVPPTSVPSASTPPKTVESTQPRGDTSDLGDSDPEEPASKDIETADTSNEQDTASLEASSHTVVEGENLWSIAKDRLAQTQANTPTNSQVGPYWSAVIEQNRAALRSGNINLIYPGEVINLPAIEDIRTD